MTAATIPIEMDVRLPNERHAPGLGRRVVSTLAGHVPPDQLEGAQLLTSELVTNAMRHAGLHSDETVRLRIAFGRRLRIEVTDAGPGFRWGRMGASDPMQGDGGLAFLLVAALAASWGVETGPPTRVWFKLDQGRPFDAGTARVSRPATSSRG